VYNLFKIIHIPFKDHICSKSIQNSELNGLESIKAIYALLKNR
jgi:hypothetical protein